MRGVNVERLGRLARTLRVRQRLTQAELAARAGVSRRAVSMLERGRARRLLLGTVESILGALGARIDLRVFWNGPELDRLLDAGHAALGASVKRRLERWGWMVRVEVSYSRFGERGRIDLLAFHAATGTLVVIEIKTELVDVQALLGSLDAKTRLAATIAQPFGWEVRAVVPAIVFQENRTTRNRLGRVIALFDRFSVHGRAATTWLRRPDGAPSGLLWFTAGPQRVPARSTSVRVRTPGGGSRRDLKADRPAAH
jgi:transcriptional regulator with XRE-family HTH domain